MSILLESLNQSKNKSDNNIPSVDDSHFDDEMLGDEWLLKKLVFWKVISGILLIVLVISWFSVFSIYYYSKALVEIPDEHSELYEQVTLIEPLPKEKIIAEPVIEETSISNKPVYQPKRIETPIKTDQAVRRATPVDVEPTGKIIDFESLSKSDLAELPELEISSYAVSSNIKKSFVVLNGAFYSVGETIAPYLVLKEINQEYIVVIYKNQLIRKKYSL